MPLAVFDVTKNYAKIGELFDTSKKYVYKDPGSGMLATPLREPSTGYLYNLSSYWWREFESWNGQVTQDIYWAGTAQSIPGYVETITAGFYTYYRGDFQTTDVTYENGEPNTSTYYSIARSTMVNVNVIRMPHLWTMYNTSNSLTYSFDGESFTVGPSPPSLPQVSPSPRLFYLGII